MLFNILKKLPIEQKQELLDIKNLTIYGLNTLRNYIIEELDNRNMETLEIDKEYKSFVSRDLGLYIGKVDKDLNLILFNLSSRYSISAFNGKFDSSYEYYHGNYWCEVKNSNILEIFNKFDFSNCDDSVYNDISDQNIPDIKTMVQLAHQETYKCKEADEILSVLKNNNYQTQKNIDNKKLTNSLDK